MDMKDFTYRQTPVKKTRVYEVHTLSQDGLNQYLDKNSYVHNFLKSISPHRSSSNSNQNEFYSQESKEKNKHQAYESDKHLKESSDFNNNRRDKGSVITINVNNFHKNIYYKPASDSVNKEKAEKVKFENNHNHSFNNYSSNLNNNSESYTNNDLINNENTNLDKENLETPVSENKKSPEKILSRENSNGNFEGRNKKNAFLQTSKHMLFNNHRLSKNNKNTNALSQGGFLSPKYSEDYNFAISTLKEDFFNNLISNNIHNSSKNVYGNNRFLQGNFKSYEIPHLEYKRNSSNFRINLIRDKLENTILKSGKNSNVNPNKNEELDTINKKIQVENIKLKNYFENIDKFSKNNNQKMYPSVSEMTNSVNLRTTKLRLMNNKFMGERYDPTNYA